MVADPLDPLPTGLASVGTFALDLRSGAVLASHAPERPLPPASNAKLLTTAIALDRVGPDYRFETRVHAVGDRDGDRIDGDLVLEGRGSPDFSVADLRTLAERASPFRSTKSGCSASRISTQFGFAEH